MDMHMMKIYRNFNINKHKKTLKENHNLYLQKKSNDYY